MPVSIVVGGQFGSEGKGKVAHFFARELKARAVIRVGGPNSGHTVIDENGNPVILRQLPTAAILPDVTCVLGAGSYVNLDLLAEEIKRTRIETKRLLIDPHAVIVTDVEEQQEKASGLRTNIGSTQSGTGAAVINRISRAGTVRLAESEESLKPFVAPVVSFLRDCLAKRQRIIIEGTQGFGLSVLHSPYYPYVTSRDTSAAAFLSEVGLSPIDVDDIVLVLRTFPIRVAGNSGVLPNEISWTEVAENAGSSKPIIEYTSVTKAVRRVARFHDEVVRNAIKINNPTRIVLNHLDYVDMQCREQDGLTERASRFVEEIESLIERQIDYIGYSPSTLIACSYIRSKFKLA